jgi:hypothetical protein
MLKLEYVSRLICRLDLQTKFYIESRLILRSRLANQVPQWESILKSTSNIHSRLTNRVPYWESVSKSTCNALSTYYESNTESTQYNAIRMFSKSHTVHIKLKCPFKTKTEQNHNKNIIKEQKKTIQNI